MNYDDYYKKYGICQLQCSKCGHQEHKLYGRKTKRFVTMYCMGCKSDMRMIPRTGDVEN